MVSSPDSEKKTELDIHNMVSQIPDQFQVIKYTQSGIIRNDAKSR